MQDIIVQLLLVILALWFRYTGYQENRKARPFSWHDLGPSKGFDDLFIAGRLVTGAGIIIL